MRAAQPFTPLDIRHRLLDLNLPAAELARQLGATPSSVNMVIRWRRRTPWIRRGIAQKLNIPYVILWGEEDPGVRTLKRGRRPRREQETATTFANTTKRARAGGRR